MNILSPEEITRAWDLGIKSKDGATALERIAKAQDEISYKAGYDEHKREIERTLTFIGDVCMEHRTAAIREVVEWIHAHSQLERCDPDVMTYFIDYLAIDYPDWQSKLIEWGIKEQDGENNTQR